MGARPSVEGRQIPLPRHAVGGAPAHGEVMPVASGFDQALFLQRTLSQPARAGITVEELRVKATAARVHGAQGAGESLEPDLVRRLLAAAAAR